MDDPAVMPILSDADLGERWMRQDAFDHKGLGTLFKRYFGPRGLITTAFSNKAARLVSGKTSHALAKLRGTKSLAMPHLRIRSDKESRALAAVWAPAGAFVKNEFPQQSASLEHALFVRAMYGRCHAHGLAGDR